MKKPNAKPPNAHNGRPTAIGIHEIWPLPSDHNAGSNDMAIHIKPPQAAPMTIHVFLVITEGLGGIPRADS
jgi:hypothetical protein